MILDDEQIVRRALKMGLERSGYRVLTAENFKQFTQVMQDCDAVLCDIILPGNNGLQALKWARENFPNTPVIMMTGKPTVETAAEAMRFGAFDYLAKPVQKNDLLLTLQRAIQHRQLVLDKARLEAENESYRQQLENQVEEKSQALQESQEFLTTLTNTMADAVFSIRLPDYKIEYVNQAVSTIFGYQPAELLGQSFDRLFIDANGFAVYHQKINAAIEQDRAQTQVELPMLKKDETSIMTEVVSTFICREGEAYPQIISVVRDVTQRSFLLGVVAHELRNPLGLVTGFVHVLLSEVQTMDRESLEKYLGVISEHTSHMLAMLDGLLDVTKIEFGEVALDIRPENVVPLLARLTEEHKILAKDKNITLQFVPEKPELVCACDPTKVGEVLANLIDNAIKYSNPDTTVQIVARSHNSGVWVGVKDQGSGINPQEIQHVFKGFSHKKVSTRPTAGERSTGLGLAICKRIIEAHGGQIGVESVPGQGSTFWFTLPNGEQQKPGDSAR